MRQQVTRIRRQTTAVGTITALAAVVFSFCVSFVALAEFELKHWTKWREIVFQSESKSEYVLAGLDGKVFDAAQPDLSDLRVVDESGNEVGSKTITVSPEFFRDQQKAKPALLSATFKPYEKNRDAGHKKNQSAEDSEKKMNPSDWLIDLGAKHTPSVGLEFETATTNFRRRILVQGSNDEKDDKEWGDVGSIEIFDIRVGRTRHQMMKFDYPEAQYRYLCVTIFNLDDQPLPLKDLRVFGWPRQLLFRREPGKSYRLFYGNPQAESPRYDLAEIAAYLKFDQLPTATLGNENRNESFVVKSEEKSLFEKQPA